MRLLPAFAALLGLAASALPAGAQAGCSTQRFATPEGNVDATFCSAPATGTHATVAETFAAAGKTVNQSLSIELVPGASVSRAVDDVDLHPLGIPRTVHVQIRYANGSARMTGGLLTPGAIPVTPAAK